MRCTAVAMLCLALLTGAAGKTIRLPDRRRLVTTTHEGAIYDSCGHKWGTDAKNHVLTIAHGRCKLVLTGIASDHSDGSDQQIVGRAYNQDGDHHNGYFEIRWDDVVGASDCDLDIQNKVSYSNSETNGVLQVTIHNEITDYEAAHTLDAGYEYSQYYDGVEVDEGSHVIVRSGQHNQVFTWANNCDPTTDAPTDAPTEAPTMSPTDACGTTCELNQDGLITVAHDPSSGHTRHRCYIDYDDTCVCECTGHPQGE